MTKDGEPFDDAVPVPIAATRPKRDEDADELPPWSLAHLRHKAVVVIANGFTYRGTLIGADDDELHLKGELRFVTLPLATITSVREDDDPPAGEGA